MNLMSRGFRGTSSSCGRDKPQSFPERFRFVLSGRRLLHVQDHLLAKEDEKLPFAGHVVRDLKHPDFIEDFGTIVFMRPQEAAAGNLKGQVLVRAPLEGLYGFVAAFLAVRSDP